MKEMKQEMNLISKSVKPRRVITLSVFLFCLASLALMIHTPASLGDQLTTYTNPTIPVWSISFPSSWMANNQTSGSFGITYQQLGLSVIWNQGQDAHQIRSSFEATLGNLGAIQVQSDNSGTQFGTQVETVVYTLTSNQGSQEDVVARYFVSQGYEFVLFYFAPSSAFASSQQLCEQIVSMFTLGSSGAGSTTSTTPPSSSVGQLTSYTNPTTPDWSISYPSSWTVNTQLNNGQGFEVSNQTLQLYVLWFQGQSSQQVRSSLESTLGQQGSMQVLKDDQLTQFGTQVDAVVYNLAGGQGNQSNQFVIVARYFELQGYGFALFYGLSQSNNNFDSSQQLLEQIVQTFTLGGSAPSSTTAISPPSPTTTVSQPSFPSSPTTTSAPSQVPPSPLGGSPITTATQTSSSNSSPLPVPVAAAPQLSNNPSAAQTPNLFSLTNVTIVVGIVIVALAILAGYKIKKPKRNLPPAFQPPTLQTPTLFQQNRFCQNCGTQTQPGGLFCSNCGYKSMQ